MKNPLNYSVFTYELNLLNMLYLNDGRRKYFILLNINLKNLDDLIIANNILLLLYFFVNKFYF